MGKLLDYAEQLDEVVRLVQNDGYSVKEAIKIVITPIIKVNNIILG